MNKGRISSGLKKLLFVLRALLALFVLGFDCVIIKEFDKLSLAGCRDLTHEHLQDAKFLNDLAHVKLLRELVLTVSEDFVSVSPLSAFPAAAHAGGFV